VRTFNNSQPEEIATVNFTVDGGSGVARYNTVSYYLYPSRQGTAKLIDTGEPISITDLLKSM